MLRLRNDCSQGQKKPMLTVSDTWPTAWLDLPLSNTLWRYIDFTLLPHFACAGIRLADLSPIIAWREASETKMSIGYDSCLFVPCSEDIECNKCSIRQASWHPSNKHVVYSCPTEWHKSVFWSDAFIFCQCPPKLLLHYSTTWVQVQFFKSGLALTFFVLTMKGKLIFNS